MSIFSQNDKIVEILEHDCTLLSVISRFGISLGFGNATVANICEKYQVDPDFFLSIINVYHNDNYFPEKKFEKFLIRDIVEYLARTHHYYKTFVLPDIERLFKILLQTDSMQKDILVLLERIYSNFKLEFNSHIDFEDLELFPFAVNLENSQFDKVPESIEIPEFSFINIHSQLDDTIFDIKNILIKYMPPTDDIYNTNAFATAIFRFEKDLKDHARIEDRILYPKVKHLYAQLSS